jgi:hypothetical protein
MTGDASIFRARRAGIVLRVVKLRIKASEIREVLEWRVTGVQVRVADHTHRNIIGHKLLQVTIRAGLVTGETWRRRVVLGATVA